MKEIGPLLNKKMSFMKKEEDKHVSDAELFALLEKIGAKEIKYPPGTYIIMPWRRMKKEE